MQDQATARRAYGTGSLIERTDRAGRVVFYGKWRDTVGRQVMRKVGVKRQNGAKDGLTKREAEAALRRLIDSTTATANVAERVTVEEACERYVIFLRDVKRRKPTTIGDYSYMVSRHIAPFFRGRAIPSVTAADVEQYVKAKLAPADADRAARRKSERLTAKTLNNHLNFLHGVFEFATNERRKWATSNPVRAIDRPESASQSDELRFLSVAEVEALIRAVPNDELGAVDRVLYLTAAMTGLRQGELCALRWRDVDWVAQTIRVRLNFTRGAEGTPKSGKGRAVPMAPRVAGELERHFRAQGWSNDDEAADRLVFAHPLTGSFYDASKMRKRFDRALKVAKVRRIVFHELRHTFGTTCAAHGVPPRTLQEWMGHADLKTTERYMHYAPRSVDAQAIGAAFAVEAPALEVVSA